VFLGRRVAGGQHQSTVAVNGSDLGHDPDEILRFGGQLSVF
jgi:hypothetical protein